MNKLKVKLTCGACPEQYDVFLGEKQIGYLRFRGGIFRAEYPDCGGEIVYEKNFLVPLKGYFHTEKERKKYIYKAQVALLIAHVRAIESKNNSVNAMPV